MISFLNFGGYDCGRILLKLLGLFCLEVLAMPLKSQLNFAPMLLPSQYLLTSLINLESTKKILTRFPNKLQHERRKSHKLQSHIFISYEPRISLALFLFASIWNNFLPLRTYGEENKEKKFPDT